MANAPFRSFAMDILLTSSAWLGRFCFPPVEERRPLTLLALLIPVALHLLAIHLLFRYPASHRPAKFARQAILLPLIVLYGIRAAYAFTMVDKPCAPGHSGTPRFGGQQQLRIFFPMYWTFYSAIKAFEIAFYPRPRLQSPLLDLDQRLKSLAKGKKKDQDKVPEAGADQQPSDVAKELPTFLPGTKIPLEVDFLCSLRGAGWHWGPKYSASTPAPTPFALVDGDEAAVQVWRSERIQYLKSRLSCLLTTLLLVDIIDAINKSEVLWGVLAGEGAPIVNGVLQHEGMDFTTLPVPSRLFLSFLTGSFIVIAMGLLHSVPAILFVLPSVIWPRNAFVANYLWSDPAHWMPPMVDLRWWAVGNIRRLWSRHWHQVLRRCFFVGAFNPTKAVLIAIFGAETEPAKLQQTNGKTTAPTDASKAHKEEESSGSNKIVRMRHRHGPKMMVINAVSAMSTFVLSGVMHEFFLIAAARNEVERTPLRVLGLGPPILYADGSKDRGGGMLLFFALQGVACIAEELFEAASGKKVGGSIGTIWVWTFITFSSYPFAKVWWYFGIANGPQINPYTRKLVDWVALKVLST